MKTKVDKSLNASAIATGHDRWKHFNYDREAAFKAKHGRSSEEYMKDLASLVPVPRIGHMLAACADPAGGFKSPAERRKVLRRLAKSGPQRPPQFLSMANF